MLANPTKKEWVLIVTMIAIFRYLALWCLLYFVLVAAIGHVPLITHPFSIIVEAVGLIEICFYLFWFLPYKRHLQRPAVYPPSLTRAERSALFSRCLTLIPDFQWYARGWMQGAPMEDLRREDMKDWLLWALFEREGPPGQDDEELEEYMLAIEEKLGKNIPPGRGKAKPMRLNFEPVKMTHRSLTFYLLLGLSDFVTSLILLAKGFHFYRLPRKSFFKTFPFRPLSLLSRHQSPSNLTYFYRPHRSKTKRPIVLLHGIGVGMLPYIPILSQIPKDVGVLAIEIQPISTRITTPLPLTADIVASISTIVATHNLRDFVLVSQSYGTFLVRPILLCPELRPRITANFIMDPVALLLHLPDVAYNFTRRPPKQANEIMLYYFASTDPSVAYTLARRFCWREYLLWLEELRGINTTVLLGGRDCVTNPDAVASYVYSGSVDRDMYDREAWRRTADEWTGERELELYYLAERDHGQALLAPKALKAIKKIMDTYCSREIEQKDGRQGEV